MEYFSLDIYDKLRELDFNHLDAEIIPYTLDFSRPAATSRGIMHHHEIYYLKIWEVDEPSIFGLGEFAPLQGLSIDHGKNGLKKLYEIAAEINHFHELLPLLEDFPAVRFALETALLDLHHLGSRLLFPSKFTDGNEVILINGLIWMGDPAYMIEQINRKMEEGFSTLKLKVGALDFKQELQILREIRDTFGHDLEVRLDANGAFHPDDALEKLEKLAAYDIHSIEQPIRAGQWETMAEICTNSTIPVALDEELIGLTEREERQEMLETVLPAYLIFKPTLIGGFTGTQEWIELAEENGLGWWITSALESNIGLNAVAQFAFTQQNPMAQGLGTGELYKNNIISPLEREGEFLKINTEKSWKLPFD